MPALRLWQLLDRVCYSDYYLPDHLRAQAARWISEVAPRKRA